MKIIISPTDTIITTTDFVQNIECLWGLDILMATNKFKILINSYFTKLNLTIHNIHTIQESLKYYCSQETVGGKFILHFWILCLNSSLKGKPNLSH